MISDHPRWLASRMNQYDDMLTCYSRATKVKRLALTALDPNLWGILLTDSCRSSTINWLLDGEEDWRADSLIKTPFLNQIIIHPVKKLCHATHTNTCMGTVMAIFKQLESLSKSTEDSFHLSSLDEEWGFRFRLFCIFMQTMSHSYTSCLHT